MADHVENEMLNAHGEPHSSRSRRRYLAGAGAGLMAGTVMAMAMMMLALLRNQSIWTTPALWNSVRRRLLAVSGEKKRLNRVKAFLLQELHRESSAGSARRWRGAHAPHGVANVIRHQ